MSSDRGNLSWLSNVKRTMKKELNNSQRVNANQHYTEATAQEIRQVKILLIKQNEETLIRMNSFAFFFIE